jgi:DNA-binding transcriptional LysR family regulator
MYSPPNVNRGTRTRQGATKVGEVRRVICASPSYLATRRAPNAPADLADHDLIEMSGMAAFGNIWSFEAGRDLHVRLSPRLKVNQTDVAVAAAHAGRA